MIALEVDPSAMDEIMAAIEDAQLLGNGYLMIRTEPGGVVIFEHVEPRRVTLEP